MRKFSLAGVAGIAVLLLSFAGTATAQEDATPAADAVLQTDSPPDSAAPPIELPPSYGPNPQLDPNTIGSGTGSHFPLSNPFIVQPNGLKLGPFHLLDVSTSGFFESASGPTGPSQDLWGSQITSNIFLSKQIGRGTLTILGQPEMSFVSGQVYVNANTGTTYAYQLSQRWTFQATEAFSYYQNEAFLQNPQYLLYYVNGGFVAQAVFAQTRGSSLYNSTNLSGTYQMSGKTQVSFTPELGVTLLDQLGSLETVRTLGFGISVSHTLNPNRSVSVFYNFSHLTSTSEELSSGGSSWNGQSIGAGIQQKIGHDWAIAANIAASYQHTTVGLWTPSGSVSISRLFRNGSASAAYSRSQASQVFVSSGFFDQADVSYSRHLGRKMTTFFGAGAFRGVLTGSRESGERVGANFSYQLRSNVALTSGYNFVRQRSDQASLYNGNTTFVTFGLTWILGRPSGL
jgi:hypothetical protein